MENSVFISFRTPERELVLPLYDRLRKEGFHVFMSSECLEWGDEWPARLTQEMKEANLMIAFITNAYLSDDYQVNKEWDLANSYKKLILPILFKVEEGGLPDTWVYYSGHQYLPISNLSEVEINVIIAKCKQSINLGKVQLNSPREVFDQANALCDKGEWDRASILYERIAAEIPDAHPCIIYCRLLLRHYRAARDAARKALMYCPKNPDAYFFSAMSNIAGRDEYQPIVLERASELLIQAWQIQPDIKHCYLAICIAHLYNNLSFRIPGPIQLLVRTAQSQPLNPKLMESIRNMLSI